jgi:hypothetical protein
MIIIFPMLLLFNMLNIVLWWWQRMLTNEAGRVSNMSSGTTIRPVQSDLYLYIYIYIFHIFSHTLSRSMQ